MRVNSIREYFLKPLQEWNPQGIHTRIVETIRASFGFSSENEVYGIRRILCDFAGVHPSSRIYGRLQHGWVSENLNETLIRNSLIKSFVWTKKAEEHLRNRNILNAFAIGAPWLYLLALLERMGIVMRVDESLRAIEELWIFGSHSVTKSEAQEKKKSLLNFLDAANASKAKNKKVLLFYVDYELIKDSFFERYPDLDISTSLLSRIRTSTSDAHLYNLFWILSQAKVMVVNYPTTALLYGLTLDCRLSWFEDRNYCRAVENAENNEDLELVSVLKGEKLSKSELFEFAMNRLGKNSMLTAEEMRALFGWRHDGQLHFGRISSFIRSLAGVVLGVKSLWRN